jgi:hypothetical protein
MKLVVIESPLAGDFARNARYAKLCMLDAFRRGEAPFASHLLYTQMLNDEIPTDRKLGMAAGFAWGAVAELAVVYRDLGVSEGMRQGIENHVFQGTPVEYRVLPPDLMELLDRPRSLGDQVRPTSGFEPSKEPHDSYAAWLRRINGFF